MPPRTRILALTISSALCAALPPTTHAAAETTLNRVEISRELSQRPDDPLLNFLSGLAYESAAVASTEARELARVGYLMALRQDNGFWRASYQLGLMALEDRDAFAATRYLLTSALNAPQEARVFRALARAAYCAGDIDLAAAALAQANTLGSSSKEEDLLTAALIASARGDRAEVELAAARLTPPLREALINRMSIPREPLAAADATAKAEPPSDDAATRMAVVDVVVIRRRESDATRDGINLLESLSLQLGSNLLNRTWAKSRDEIEQTLSSYTISSERNVELTIPAVTYSLNLANARGNSSRIEARPSLLIRDDSEAKIFNGGTLTFATDGQLSSSSETREVGLALSVKPKFLNDDVVKLAVTVTLENFVTTPAPGNFRQAVQTEKSSTEVAADVRFGQTMLISGGSTTTVTRGNSKTPLAGDVPLLGKLFAAKSTSQIDDELLILLSLRRVAGQAALRDGEQERELTAQLRERVFPTLAPEAPLAPETRQLFYRLDNPARRDTAPYLAPVLSASSLKKFLSRR